MRTTNSPNSPNHWPTDRLTDQPTDRRTDQWTDGPTNGPTDGRTDWQTYGPTDQQINQPTDWPTNRPISSYPQSLHYKFNLNQNWREINIPLSGRTGFSLVQKMDTYWFLCKKLKIFDPKLICEIKWTLRVLLYHFKILNNTFSLIPNLLKSSQ